MLNGPPTSGEAMFPPADAGAASGAFAATGAGAGAPLEGLAITVLINNRPKINNFYLSCSI